MYFQNFNLCDRVHCRKRIYHWWIYKWTTLPNKNHCRIQRWNMEGCGILSPWSYQSRCNHLRISYNGCWWFASIWNSVSVDLNRKSLDQSLINSHLVPSLLFMRGFSTATLKFYCHFYCQWQQNSKTVLLPLAVESKSHSTATPTVTSTAAKKWQWKCF